MRSRPFHLVACAAVVLIATAAAPGPQAIRQASLRATVITVFDGDTVKVRLAAGGDEKVRLIGVDSPELDDARERVRLMAFLAKRFAFSRLYGIEVELIGGPEARDAFGRLLAFVRLGEGTVFNVALVREGFAHAYLKFPFDETLRRELKDAESEARRAGRGLWGNEPFPEVAAADAGRHLGELARVRFRCSRSFKRGGFRLLEADGAAFDAAIPLEVFKTLPGPLDFEGRTVEAAGLVEVYKGRPQIVIGVPVQLKRVD